MNPRILIVDDDEAHRSMLRTVLRGWGYATDEADDGDTAVEKVRNEEYGLILSDIRMARMDGLAALSAIQELRPGLPVLIMTAYSSVDTVKQALRLGAYDYLVKPLDFEELERVLGRLMEHRRLEAENRKLSDLLRDQSAFGILGQSPCMGHLVDMVRTVAPSEATVLITGESGTGKELVARAIQKASRRADGPFVTVNCAALSESLLESELFGHEKGAFTGADRRREGRFRQADGGTLFLDEIGEFPMLLQAKLLRALQQGEVQRVGSDVPITVDVRLIAATNRDLLAEVAAGRFREDLYYRLNVIGLEVPPLRERPTDIPLLAMAFLERFALANRKHLKGFAFQAMERLCQYGWPGNVRELENVVERAVILCTADEISERELPHSLVEQARQTRLAETSAPVPVTSESTPLLTAGRDDSTALFGGGLGDGEQTLDAIERRAILATLRESGDNKSEAARRLGITRATLHNKLKKYGLSATDED